MTQTLFRYDTRLDASPQDAARRAAAWMSPELAAREASAVTAGGGVWWSQLAAGDGWTSTSVARDAEPAPDLGPGKSARRVLVTVTPHTKAGVKAPAVQRFVVVAALTRVADGWRAERLAIEPAGTAP